MKFHFFYSIFIALFGLFLFLGNSNGRAAGSNWGNTGAPGDETLSNGQSRTCQSCHATGDIQVTLDIELSEAGNIVESYIPGNTYDVQVRINHAAGPMPSGYGFQIVALDNDNSSTDSWSEPSSNAKIATASNTSRSYVEHNGVNAENVFEMKWTAPTEGSGNITFYASGNGVNNNGSTGGDGAATSTLSVEEGIGTNTQQIALQQAFTLFPNPVQDVFYLNIDSDKNIEVSNIQILNSVGLLMEEKSISDWNKAINITAYSSGIYFIKINTKQGMVTKRFVKK